MSGEHSPLDDLIGLALLIAFYAIVIKLVWGLW
jgi:hypothetical protein